jgi:hypothetical protein
MWFEKEVFRLSANGGNNASDRQTAKGVELLILNYNCKNRRKIKLII